MAFPAVQTADTKNGVQTSNSSSWTLTYPTNLQSGDLILAFVSTDGNTVGTWPTGWVESHQQSGANTLHMARKLSDGTETGTFTLTLDGSEQGAWRIFRITGWYGTLATGLEHVSSLGTDANPDPPNFDPINWDVEDTLWFAVCGVDTSRTISVYPLADNQTADVSGGANGATLGICSTNSAVVSLNPGTFTISNSDDWVAYTVAVRPAIAAATFAPPFPRTDRRILDHRELDPWPGRVI